MIDASRLQKSWATIAQFGDQVPLFFYSTLFLTNPGTREMFPITMSAQRDRLVSALGRVISQVDDLAAVAPVLQQLGREHRKFGVVRDHFPAVGDALLSTLEHFLGSDWDDELARDWAEAFGIVARVMIEAADAASDTPPWYNAVVTDYERRAPDIAVIRVTPDAPVPYRPGQSVSLETGSRPRLWRYFSPATLPDPDGSFELHVRAVGGGMVSTALVQSTQTGDALRLGAPVGEDLTLDPDSRGGIVLIAGGTGLAPMKALVQQVAAEQPPRAVQLYWGGRRHHDLYDLRAMERLTSGQSWITFVPCVSTEPTTGSYLQPGTAVDVALRHGDLPGRDIYVCGSPGMVAATLSALGDAGVETASVHWERLGSNEEASV
ncbi:MAG TPA: globin domain-containing protein [Acidimicrobiales bacterium]|nr:globin domain-containing protein [Acidimicrobiales bacterium]